jgi:predicted nucleic acid-binding protein
MAAVRLYVDTNIFIYALENNDALAKKLLQLISLNEGRKQPFLAKIPALDRVVAEVEP